MKLTLPFPPSANRYWRHCRGRTFVSAEATQYRRAVADVLLRAKREPLAGDVRVVLDFYRPAKRGDLDNRIKILCDCLQGAAYENDSQIVEIHARQYDDKRAPRVEIEITQA